ncbi:MAG: LysR substrate-binding domain-containing protein [Polyangiales bacterium]
MRLDAQNQRVDLLRDGVDVAIRGGELPDSDLLARRLASATMWLYGSVSFRGAALLDVPLIVAPGDEAMLRRAGLVVSDASAVIDDRSAVADAITWGGGMGLLPAVPRPACAQETMVRLHDAPIATLPVHAVYHASQRDDVRVRVVVDEIEAQLQATL